MAETTAPSYPGPELDTEQSQIRLLTVLAGTRDEPLLCKLQTVNVAEGREYEALSYAWGTPTMPHSISVNGKAFCVGDNLFQALMHLRLSDTNRVLWVDAICINQSNISERNHQVRQMAEIYSRATRVVAWLGLSTVSSQLAMGFLREMYLGGSFVRQELKLDRRWEDVNKLCQREYWKRLWIIQEICLAATVTVMCGSDKIPWAYIAGVRKDRLHVWAKYLSADEREFMRSYPARIDEQRTNRQRKGAVLWTLLETFQDSKCKDFHDNVYGLLALSTDCGSNGIRIDYSVSPWELYRDVLDFYRKEYLHNSSPSAGAPLMKLSEFLQEFLRLSYVGSWMAKMKAGERISKIISSSSIPRPSISLPCITRIPICNVILIQEFASSSTETASRRFEKLAEGAEYPYPDRLRRWSRWDSRIFADGQDAKLIGVASIRGLPEFSISSTEAASDPTEFIGRPIRPTITTGLLGRRPELAESYFRGIAPPGSRPGDLVCAFVDSNIAVVVRPVQTYYLSARRAVKQERQIRSRDDPSRKPSATERFRRWRKARQRLEDIRGEQDAVASCTIVGRCFFDFRPLSKLDGITTRLTRDKRVETTQQGQQGQQTVSIWPGTLTVSANTLRLLSAPGDDEYERMNHNGIWEPLVQEE